MTNYIVYKHTSPCGKVYIGITSQEPHKRWNGGSGYLNNDYFMKAIKKHGWNNFEHVVLYQGLTKAEAESKEIELIAFYKSDQRKFGYNIQHGGNSIGKHSEETKKKIGIANKGNPSWIAGKHHSTETKTKLSEIHQGATMPDEVKKKISEAHKGVKLTKDHVEKIANANRGKKRSDEQKAHISCALKGHKGVKHTQETKDRIASKLSKPIKCVETGIVYNSIREAERHTGISSGGIVGCLKGRHHTAGGYHWEYI
jgi:group I intron endonuclease